MKNILTILLILGSLVINAQTTYYVDDISGDDGDDGLTPATAFQTIARVDAIPPDAGDSVLFIADGVWRDELTIFNTGTSVDNMIYYGRYGAGRNPRILGSIQATDWTPEGTPNIWQSATSFSTPTAGGHEGAMFVENLSDSVIHANERQTALVDLTEEFEWYYSSGTVYMYAPTDPDTRYQAVEVGQLAYCILTAGDYSWIETNGIDMRYAIQGGWNAGYPSIGGLKGLVFRNCSIQYHGVKGSGSAYGIGAAHDSTLIENCYFSDCGRRAISYNFYVTQLPGEEIVINNLIVRNNKFWRGYHTSSLDCSSQLSNSDTVKAVYFYNNYIDDSELTDFTTSERSNQLYFQLGGGVAYTNNAYVFGNVFVGATARNILIEGMDTSYIWNNTIVGHNQWMSTASYSPYANVSYTYNTGSNNYYKNNILYDNIGEVPLDNHGVFMEYAGASGGTGVFEEKDYNLYYTLFPNYDNDRNFSGHRLNNVGVVTGYWYTGQWATYLSDNSITQFEINSPIPADPLFTDYDGKDYTLTASSTAIAAGDALSPITVTDVFGVTDTINKYDINGVAYSQSDWDLGAYAYSAADTTATDILTFVLSEQTGSATINDVAHTVDIEVVYGTSLTSLTPTITVSQTATISPLSGTAQNFSSPFEYTVTGGDAVTTQIWTVTVTVASASTETDIVTFTIPNQQNSSVNAGNHTVTVNMPYGTDASDLSTSITISSGATIIPTSGTNQDFSSPVNYTVTAEDGITDQIWVVTVIVAAQPTVIYWIFNDGSIGEYPNGDKAVEYE